MWGAAACAVAPAALLSAFLFHAAGAFGGWCVLDRVHYYRSYSCTLYNAGRHARRAAPPDHRPSAQHAHLMNERGTSRRQYITDYMYSRTISATHTYAYEYALSMHLLLYSPAHGWGNACMHNVCSHPPRLIAWRGRAVYGCRVHARHDAQPQGTSS